MSNHPFQVGEQVWTRYDDEWWPAKVIDPAAANLADDGTLSVVFYSAGAELCRFAYHPALVVPFELSSEKAVTNNAEIRAAIERASKDTEAIRVAHPQYQHHPKKRTG